VYRLPAGFALAGEGETGTEAIDILGGASSIISVSPSSSAETCATFVASSLFWNLRTKHIAKVKYYNDSIATTLD
jgi:hypothetical protein